MKVKFIFAATVIIVIGIAVFVMMNRDSKSSTYEITQDNLIIGGSFGVSVPIKEITALELTKIKPEILAKTNGSGLGDVYKGEFKLNDGSKARLYIDVSILQFIKFVHKDTIFYINAESAEKTVALFEQLAAVIN